MNMTSKYNYVICPLCGSDNSKTVFPSTSKIEATETPEVYRCTNPGYGTHDRIVKCQECNLAYSNPRSPSDAILESYRAVEDPVYVQEQDGRQLTFTHHIRHLERQIGPANGRKLLDVGCYTGIFVDVALKHGWNAMGVEPSHWASAFAQQQGLPVIEGTLATANITDASQDVVTLWDVIEHLPDPLVELREVARVVKPDGWTVVHTMDIDSLAAKVMHGRWPWLMKMHLIYFSQQTMSDMLRKVGFQPVYSKAMGRYLRLGYFATRVAALSPRVGKPFSTLIERTGLKGLPIPLNFGDLFTVYARRTSDL